MLGVVSESIFQIDYWYSLAFLANRTIFQAFVEIFKIIPNVVPFAYDGIGHKGTTEIFFFFFFSSFTN